MKKLWFLFVLIFSLLLYSEISAQNVSPQFSELKGMEDTQGNTNLLYRVRSAHYQGFISSDSNIVYALVPHTQIDSMFLYDGSSCNQMTGYGRSVDSYDIWNNDLSKFIYCGIQSNCFEGSGYISRFDSQNVRGGVFEFYNKISISKQNDSLIYCAYPIIKSTDGGFSWDIVSDSLHFLSLSPFNDQVYFADGPHYWWGASYLYKTTNGGITFFPVDTLMNTTFDFYFDADEQHIYRIDSWTFPDKALKRSSSQGNAFTWQTVYTSNNDIYISIDNSQSGAVYLADGKNIFYSSNYGSSFSAFRELDNSIIGIYKKPNSQILYAASKYKIYEITQDTTIVIKSLPIPEEVLNYYPLAIGNKWIYDETIANFNGFPYTYSYDNNIREVLEDTMLSNGKRYFKLFDETTMNDTNYLFERIDSSNGLVYRYNFNAPAGEEEYLIDDLLAAVSDTILSSRWRVPYSYIPDVIFYEQTLINIFGNYKYKKVFRTNFLSSYSYGLVESFGIDSVFFDWDFGYSESVLKGCIINGVVYGDTTLTNIDNEINYTPTEFRLEQNYPNPFNPSTKISWQSPISSWQTLKVYDILGNEVAALVNEYRNAGKYEVDFNASKLSSGVYFYRLQAGSFVETKKMVIIK